MGESVDFDKAKGQSQSGESTTRTRSTIEFPYNDQDDAVSVAKAILDNAGLECSVDQLAAYLKQSATSGAFRLKLSAARHFGLVETERGGRVSLTDLGQRAADPEQEAQARAESFLRVELYREVFDKFKGYRLPPRKGLEKEMVGFGVSPKQADKARQAFERSADQAGYFQHGNDRLVEPAFRIQKPDTKPLGEEEAGSGGGGGVGGGGNGGGGNDLELHPFIRGLLETLPEPGTEWAKEKRKEWIDAADQIFKLIYKEPTGLIEDRRDRHASTTVVREE